MDIKFKFLAMVFGCFSMFSCEQTKKENIIELPLVKKEGYGNFHSSLGGISPYSEDENDPWIKTRINASGIPENWTETKQGDININIYQSVYQNYYLGNITKEKYESLQKSWNWILDTLNLSKMPLKCKVAFAFGKDITGEVKMIVDANNNFDFSDDKPFMPLEYSRDKSVNQDSLAINKSIMITYEDYINRKKVKASVPLFITHMSQYNMFMNNFPQYLITEFNGEKIAVCSNNFGDLSYNRSSIALIDKNLKKGDKIKPENIILKNEYIELKSKIYKNIGVNKNVLVLEKTGLPKNQLHSTQVGFKSFPFSGNDFIKKSPISLDNFKGKYVLLDFWATWCGPCIKEMPNLKALYDKTDRSKFEIVGIVGNSSSEALIEMIERQSINWPHILSDDKNKIKEAYGIQGYPTTFLINPEGIIIAKNLRGEALEDKILSLINK